MSTNGTLGIENNSDGISVCDPLFDWSGCPSSWHNPLRNFYLAQASAFGILSVVTIVILAREMRHYGTSLRLMLLHYLNFLLLLMQLSIVIHSAILADRRAYGFDEAVVRLLNYMPHGFGYVAYLTLILLWLDHYFLVRSAGAEPRWIRHLRHRLLAAVIVLNVFFLALSVIQTRYRERWDKEITIGSFVVWVLFLTPVAAGHGYLSRRLINKLDVIRKEGRRTVKETRYFARLKRTATIMHVVVMLSLVLGTAYVACLEDVRSNLAAFIASIIVSRLPIIAFVGLVITQLAWPSVLSAEEGWIMAASRSASRSFTGRSNRWSSGDYRRGNHAVAAANAAAAHQAGRNNNDNNNNADNGDNGDGQEGITATSYFFSDVFKNDDDVEHSGIDAFDDVLHAGEVENSKGKPIPPLVLTNPEY